MAWLGRTLFFFLVVTGDGSLLFQTAARTWRAGCAGRAGRATAGAVVVGVSSVSDTMAWLGRTPFFFFLVVTGDGSLLFQTAARPWRTGRATAVLVGGSSVSEPMALLGCVAIGFAGDGSRAFEAVALVGRELVVFEEDAWGFFFDFGRTLRPVDRLGSTACVELFNLSR